MNLYVVFRELSTGAASFPPHLTGSPDTVSKDKEPSWSSRPTYERQERTGSVRPSGHACFRTAAFRRVCSFTRALGIECTCIWRLVAGSTSQLRALPVKLSSTWVVERPSCPCGSARLRATAAQAWWRVRQQEHSDRAAARASHSAGSQAVTGRLLGTQAGLVPWTTLGPRGCRGGCALAAGRLRLNPHCVAAPNGSRELYVKYRRLPREQCPTRRC